MNIFSSLNLDREPFSISPNPSFFYRSQGHYNALNRLEISIRLKKGLSLVMGDVGTGKTTLSRALFQNFEEDEKYQFHMVLDPYFKSEYEFLSHLTKLFNISPFFRSISDHRDAIEKYLYEQTVELGNTIVLVIDEGQKLSQPHLEILRTLLNYETNDYKMIQIVIFAQMELWPRLSKVKNFMDRVSYKNILEPLDFNETKEMIEYRLKQAGYESKKQLFSHQAIERIFEHSQGYPRRIILACQSALEKVIAEHHEYVTEDVIAAIVKEEQLLSRYEKESYI